MALTGKNRITISGPETRMPNHTRLRSKSPTSWGRPPCSGRCKIGWGPDRLPLL